MPIKYRMLKIGQIKKRGDEYMGDTSYAKCALPLSWHHNPDNEAGEKIDEDAFIYRRPVGSKRNKP